MSDTPLSLPSPRPASSPVLWLSGGRAVSATHFNAAVRACASKLPAAPQALLMCENNARFVVAFVAALSRGQTLLLPASRALETLASVSARYPDSYRLTDAMVPDIAGGNVDTDTALSISPDCIAALAFTSGSTGQPTPHAKPLRALSTVAAHSLQRLLDGMPVNIVTTAPAQHMYVLETAVMMALAAGCATHAERPFFPADVQRVLAEVPEPRLLVTTPVHLRNLLESGIRLPKLAMILSATAPLSITLAAQLETAFGTPVHEIYGCTEAGTIGTRRTVEGDTWTLYPDTRLDLSGAQPILSAAHLPEPVPLSDQLEQLDAQGFQLLGRQSDLIKVGGKRVSLGELTQKLLEVPGVEDGVVFVPDADHRIRHSGA